MEASTSSNMSSTEHNIHILDNIGEKPNQPVFLNFLSKSLVIDRRYILSMVWSNESSV